MSKSNTRMHQTNLFAEPLVMLQVLRVVCREGQTTLNALLHATKGLLSEIEKHLHATAR
jgi:hypothetical protein